MWPSSPWKPQDSGSQPGARFNDTDLLEKPIPIVVLQDESKSDISSSKPVTRSKLFACVGRGKEKGGGCNQETYSVCFLDSIVTSK